MKEELRVRYKVERRIDTDFDAGLAAFAKEHGWHFYGSGFNHKTRIRALAFDRKEVANASE